MPFDHRNRLWAMVQFDVFIRLYKSWKVDLVLLPEGVIREVEECPCSRLRVSGVCEQPHIYLLEVLVL